MNLKKTCRRRTILNGKELLNKTLERMLKAYVNEQRSDWDGYLSVAIMAYVFLEHVTQDVTQTTVCL